MNNDLKLILFHNVSPNRLVVNKEGQLVKLHWYNVVSRFLRWIDKDYMDTLVLTKIIDVFKNNHYEAIQTTDEIGENGLPKRISIDEVQMEHIKKLVNNTAIPILSSKLFNASVVNEGCKETKSLVKTKDEEEKIIKIKFGNQIFIIEEKIAKRSPLISNFLIDFTNNLPENEISLSMFAGSPLISAQSVEDALQFLSNRKFDPKELSRRAGMIATLDALLVDVNLFPPLIKTNVEFNNLIQDPELLANFLELWCRCPQLTKNESGQSIPFNLFGKIDSDSLSSGKGRWICELCRETTFPDGFCVSSSGNIQLRRNCEITDFSRNLIIKILNQTSDAILEIREPLYFLKKGYMGFKSGNFNQIEALLVNIKNPVLIGLSENEGKGLSYYSRFLGKHLVKKADLLGTNQLNGSSRFKIRHNENKNYEMAKYKPSAISTTITDRIPHSLSTGLINCKISLPLEKRINHQGYLEDEFIKSGDFTDLTNALRSSGTLELETLEIENLKVTDISTILSQIAKKAPKLKHLVIKTHPSHNSLSSIAALSELLKGCKNLETLSIQGINWYNSRNTATQEEIQISVQEHQNLKEIDFSSGKCTNQLFESIVQRLKNPQTGLKILRISDLPDRSEAFKELLEAAKVCKTLEQLDLRGFQLIDSKMQKELESNLEILQMKFPRTYDAHLVEGLKANAKKDLLELFESSNLPLLKEFLESEHHLDTILFDHTDPKYFPPDFHDWELQQRIGWAAGA